MTGTTGHIYEFDGIRYPSVTTILDRTQTKEELSFFRNWRRKFNMHGFKDAEDYVNYTSLRGTLIHYNIFNQMHFSVLDPSGLPKLSQWWERRDTLLKEIEHCIDMWEASGLAELFKGELIIETPSHHPVLNYAGTPDIEITGRNLLFDLKTSKDVRDKHKTQLGGYAQMLNHWNPRRIQEGLLVYLHPGMKRALEIPLNEDDLIVEIDNFNEKREIFWKIPGIKVEYNL